MHFGQVQLVPLAATTCRAQQSLAFATTPAEIGQHPTLSPAFASDRPVFRLSTWSSDLSSHTLVVSPLFCTTEHLNFLPRRGFVFRYFATSETDWK